MKMACIQPSEGASPKQAGRGRMKRCLSLPGSRSLELGLRPILMGIVNVTPDSFYGESRRLDPLEAAERALALVGEGADILDVGGESTRPGAPRVSAAARSIQSLDQCASTPVSH